MQTESKAKIQQMATQQEILQAEVQEMAEKEMDLKLERERVAKEQEELRRQRETQEEIGDIAILDSPLVLELQQKLEGELAAAQAASSDLTRRLEAAQAQLAVVSSLPSYLCVRLSSEALYWLERESVCVCVSE